MQKQKQESARHIYLEVSPDGACFWVTVLMTAVLKAERFISLEAFGWVGWGEAPFRIMLSLTLGRGASSKVRKPSNEASMATERKSNPKASRQRWKL